MVFGLLGQLQPRPLHLWVVGSQLTLWPVSREAVQKALQTVRKPAGHTAVQHHWLSLPGTLGMHGPHPPPVLLLTAEEVTSWKVSLSPGRCQSRLLPGTSFPIFFPPHAKLFNNSGAASYGFFIYRFPVILRRFYFTRQLF